MVDHPCNSVIPAIVQRQLCSITVRPYLKNSKAKKDWGPGPSLASARL
jgi:hypothetical protein